MTYYCKLCDKSIMNKSKYDHLISISHIILDESNIRIYIIFNPVFEQMDEIMKRHNIFYNEKYEKYSVSCVLKLLFTTNRVRFIRIITKT